MEKIQSNSLDAMHNCNIWKCKVKYVFQHLIWYLRCNCISLSKRSFTVLIVQVFRSINLKALEKISKTACPSANSEVPIQS